MSIINTRNLRRLLGSQSFKDTAKAIGKEVVKDNVLLASNKAINGINNRINKGIDDTVNSILDVPASLVNEIANANSVHEGTGSPFPYNPNNGRNYNYDLANQYLNQYRDYVSAKSYINSVEGNLAYHLFQKEKNRYR